MSELEHAYPLVFPPGGLQEDDVPTDAGGQGHRRHGHPGQPGLRRRAQDDRARRHARGPLSPALVTSDEHTIQS